MNMAVRTINSVVAVGTSMVKLLDGYDNLTELIISNTSTGVQLITISVGAESTSLSGIVLPVYSTYSSQEQHPPKEAVYAISNAVAGQVSIYARYED
jgi:hypothetical protein